jgi:hypothetical protein
LAEALSRGMRPRQARTASREAVADRQVSQVG